MRPAEDNGLIAFVNNFSIKAYKTVAKVMLKDVLLTKDI